ncbi:testis-expressed protein 13D isoform 1-T3 [Lycaon pictus]
MAVDFGDRASGFRHAEVVRFINNEVLLNGGGPDFYVAFRSRPWSEVEDRLRRVLADPRVPRAYQRACAWSALALGVRVAARQREQQGRRIRRLQERIEERETAAWALASELQRMREAREDVATQLRFTRITLQQALMECDVLRGRLLQAERSAQCIPLAHEIVTGPQAEQLGAMAWPLNAEPQRDMVAMGLPGRRYFEAQVPAPAVLYMPGPPSPWAQTIQTPLPMPVPYPIPFHAPLPMGVPFLPPLPSALAMDAEATVVPLQLPPLGIYPPVPCATVGFQEEVAPLWNQRSYSQEGGPPILQSTVSLGNIRNLSQEGLERPQGMVPLGDSWTHSHEGDPQRHQGEVPLRDSWTQSQEEGQENPQWVVPLGDSWNLDQEEGSERSQEVVTLGPTLEEDQESPQEMVHLGASRSHRQEESPKRPQGMAPLDASRSNSQEKDPERAQEMIPLGASGGPRQKESRKRSQRMAPLDASKRNSQGEDLEGLKEMVPLAASGSPSKGGPGTPQGMAPLGDNSSQSQEEDLERPQGTGPLGDSRSESQVKGQKRPQVMPLLEFGRSHSQEEGLQKPQRMLSLAFGRSHSQEGPKRSQATPMWDSRSQSMRENPKKKQPQGQKAKQPKGKKALDSQHQKPASGCSPVNWDCPWCKAMNFPWRKACYKCKKVCEAGGSRGLDPGQTH